MNTGGVEIFREATSQIEVPVFIVLPVGAQKDDIYRYTLVSYNKDKPQNLLQPEFSESQAFLFL